MNDRFRHVLILKSLSESRGHKIKRQNVMGCIITYCTGITERLLIFNSQMIGFPSQTHCLAD